MNQSDIRIVLLNLVTLKKLAINAEFRINRDQPFKEINHPFYFIHYKDKELVIIGSNELIPLISPPPARSPRSPFRWLNPFGTEKSHAPKGSSSS